MKEYTIIIHDRNRTTETTGTIEKLTDYFGYTLMKGQSWENERGNKRIDRHPKTIASLIKNLNNAENNAARNGYSGRWYEKKEA